MDRWSFGRDQVTVHAHVITLRSHVRYQSTGLYIRYAHKICCEKATGLEATIQFLISGQDGGNFVLHINNGTCTADEGLGSVTNADTENVLRDLYRHGNRKAEGAAGFLHEKATVRGRNKTTDENAFAFPFCE
jgi:hypothetical protein